MREKVIKQTHLIKSLVGSIPVKNSSLVSNSMQSEFLSTSIQILSQRETDEASKKLNALNQAVTASSATAAAVNHSHDEDDSNNRDVDEISPGVSPSQSFRNHLNRLLNQKPRVTEVRSVEVSPRQTIQNGQDEFEDDEDENRDTLQHEHQPQTQPVRLNTHLGQLIS